MDCRNARDCHQVRTCRRRLSLSAHIIGWSGGLATIQAQLANGQLSSAQAWQAPQHADASHALRGQTFLGDSGKSTGVPTALISEAMGHVSERMTQVYLGSIDVGRVDSANREIVDLLYK